MEQTFYDRLLSEKVELDQKREKLNSFLEGEKAKDIDVRQLSLLNIQTQIMQAYSQVLLERLALISA